MTHCVFYPRVTRLFRAGKSQKGEKSTTRARVTFKDYAFFVPKDVKDKTVKLQGKVKVKILSDGERAHLAKDGQVAVSEIPKAELRLVATGLEIH